MISNRYNKATLESEINDMKIVIENDNKSIISSQEKMNVANENIEKLNKQKIEIIKNRKQIKEDLIKADVATIENKTKYLNNDLAINRSKMSVKKDRYIQIKDVVFDVELYNKKKEEQRNIDIEQAELRTKIATIKEDIKRINNLVEKKTCPTCGHEIDIIEQNGFIEKDRQQIKELTDKGVANKAKLDIILKEIAEIEQKRVEENELNRLKPEMSAIKVQIDNIKLQLAELSRQKEEIDTNKENIRYNNEIDNKIRLVDENIRVETNIKEEQIREIQNYKNEITNFTKQIEERNNIIKKLTEEEKVIRTWNIYKQMINSKDGIGKIVLKKGLPIINNEISRLLNGICDFKVELSIDENSKVCIDLIRDGVKMDLGISASGWESTVASIALRSALSNICSFAKPNIVTYDEVLSGVSSENMENVFKLFKRIQPNYDTIIHICHDTTLVDYHDYTIFVLKENNISKIEFK